MQRKRTQSREYAVQVLYQIILKEDVAEEVLESFWQQNNTEDDSKEFATQLVLGTLEHLTDIDAMVQSYAQNWNPARMAIIDRNILRMATFELIYCEDIPVKVTINEAVNLAKKFSQEDSGKFVNGILDKISHAESLPKNKQ